jgi:uncharacterized protein (DUF3084 family)
LRKRSKRRGKERKTWFRKRRKQSTALTTVITAIRIAAAAGTPLSFTLLLPFCLSTV